MKNWCVVVVLFVVCVTTTPALAENVGPCLGQGTVIWTGDPGTVPDGTQKCPVGTTPGVIGTADAIADGRPAQDSLDERRAKAVGPAEWDGKWCTLPRTSIQGQQAAAVACVSLIPNAAGYKEVETMARYGDIGDTEAEVANHGLDQATAVLQGLNVLGCEGVTTGGTCTPTITKVDGRDVQLRLVTGSMVVEYGTPPIIQPASFRDATSSRAKDWVLALGGGALGGAIAGWGVGAMIDNKVIEPGHYHSGMQMPGAAVGAVSGMAVGAITMAIITAVED